MQSNPSDRVLTSERAWMRNSRWILLPLVFACGIPVGLFWVLTTGRMGSGSAEIESTGREAAREPTTPAGTTSSRALVADADPERSRTSTFPPSLAAWPQTPLSGEPAKQFLLETLTTLNESFGKIPSYTVTFRKQERLKGKLVAEQSFAMKVRQDPFAVYLKSIPPTPGKEVIFAKGFFEDKVIAHSEGLSRFLVPKLLVPPEHPLIRSESRHPITNAGIGNLIRNLIGYRTRDLGHPDSETTLDQWTDPSGRLWLRSLHIHRLQSAERPFTRAEVLYHPETRLPLRFTGFDWPESPSESETSPPLGERYTYDDLTLNAPLSAEDFDPANPAYHFHRF